MLLACLAVTDVMVGLTVQPLRITTDIMLLIGLGETTSDYCGLLEVLRDLLRTFCLASLLHLLLISGERYLAIKHALTMSYVSTKNRLLVASAVMWMIAILPVFIPSIFSASIVTSVVITIIYQAVVVYCEACRHEKQIIAQQVSLEAREKFKKEKKALKTTTKIIVAVAMCYLPPIISKIVLKKLLNDAFSSSIEFQVVSVWTTVTILNSLFNPLIYTVRNRQFRVAFVQLLLRKTLQEAEEIERKLFGSANVVGIIEAAHEQRMGLEA